MVWSVPPTMQTHDNTRSSTPPLKHTMSVLQEKHMALSSPQQPPTFQNQAVALVAGPPVRTVAIPFTVLFCHANHPTHRLFLAKLSQFKPTIVLYFSPTIRCTNGAARLLKATRAPLRRRSTAAPPPYANTDTTTEAADTSAAPRSQTCSPRT